MKLSDDEFQALQSMIPQIYTESLEQLERLPDSGGLHGVAIGSAEGNDELANAVVSYFVDNEEHAEQLRQSGVIPKRHVIEGPNGHFQVGTEVVISKPFEFMYFWANNTYERPCRGGNCVAPNNSSVDGTMGGIVTDPATNDHYIISNSHVLAERGRHATPHLILQHGKPFARLFKFTRPKGVPHLNKSDSAIAKMINNKDVSREINGIGVPTGIAKPVRDMEVQKSGARTGVTRSKICMVGGTFTISDNYGKYKFQDVAVAPSMSKPGDSGSLVLDNDRRIVGLLFADDGQFTAINDINTVIEDLGIQNWQWTDGPGPVAGP